MTLYKQSDEDRELSEMVRELSDEITEELKTQIPHIDLKPMIADADIQWAILNMTPEGWAKLYQTYGQHEVMDFVSEFGRGRKW